MNNFLLKADRKLLQIVWDISTASIFSIWGQEAAYMQAHRSSFTLNVPTTNCPKSLIQLYTQKCFPKVGNVSKTQTKLFETWGRSLKKN